MIPGHKMSLPGQVFITTRTYISVLLSVCALLLNPNLTQAEEEKVLDKFRIALGGYTIPSMDSTVSLTDADLGAGASVSPQDTLGLESQYTVLRLDGHYRFNNKHALTYSWYSIRSSGDKTLDEDFTWTDENGNTITIPIGARAQTNLDYDIFKLGYLWSFYHSNKVELSAGAGLHITKVAIGLTADTTVPEDSGVADVDTTVPLPVLSFVLSYQVNPKFHWYLKSEAFALAFDDWEGTYTDGTLGIEYRFWKHVGIGAGLASNSLQITEKTGEYKFQYTNRISGLLFYVAGYF